MVSKKQKLQVFCNFDSTQRKPTKTMKKLYLILFLGFLAISFYPYNKSNFVILANKKLVNDTVKALTKEDIMGEYKTGINHYASLKINIYQDSFVYYSRGCSDFLQNNGKWTYHNNTLLLTDIRSSYKNIKLIDEKYLIMQQDSFLMLIDFSENLDKSYQEICKLHNAGLNATHSTFLYKKLENHLPVPIPTIPAAYHKFLLKKPIICKITAIKNNTLLTINAGKEDGVFEGLQLHKKIEFEQAEKRKRKKREEYEDENSNPLFFTFEVISCENNTSIVKSIADGEFEFLIVEKAKKLQVGDSLYSKREK
jgi:hypothetical protein